MAFLQDFGALAGGINQGMQQGSELRQRAMAIQQMQMQLDAAKRDLQARGAVGNLFAGQGQQQGQPNMGGGPQQPQPMGAGPVPSVPPGGGPASPPPTMGAPPGGAPAPQPQQQPPPQPPTQPPQQPMAKNAGMPQAPDAAQFDPYTQMMNIAKAVKAANPGINPTDLADAVGQVIDMQKGLTPDMRAQMQYQTQILKEAMASYLQDKKSATQITIQGMRDNTQTNIADKRIGAQLQETQERIDGAMQRVIVTQNRIDQRAAAKQITAGVAAAQKTKLAVLKQRLAQDKLAVQQMLQSNADPDDQQFQDAQKKVTDDDQALTDFITKIAADKAPAQTGNPSKPPPPKGGGAKPPPPKGGAGNVVDWNSLSSGGASP